MKNLENYDEKAVSQLPVQCDAIKGKRSFKPSSHVPVRIPNPRKDDVSQGLVATRASSCFMQQSIVKRWGLDDQVVPSAKQVIFKNGVKNSVQGSVYLSVSIEGRELEVDALVIKSKGPNIILGFDFLHYHDLLMVCKE